MTPEPLTPEFVERLAKIAEAASRVAGDWEADAERHDGYRYALVFGSIVGLPAAPVRRLVDTFNADHVLTEEDRAAICEHIAAFNPALCSALLAERARLREALERSNA